MLEIILLTLLVVLLAVKISNDDNFRLEIRKLFRSEKPSADNAELSVHFIDVGQGDAILIMCGGQSMLIDSGLYEYHEKVEKYIRDCGIERLNYIINTHPHSDHMGAMSEIISDFGADEFISPDIPSDKLPQDDSFDELLLTLRDADIPQTSAEAGRKIQIGSAEAELLAPLGGTYDELNNYSVVCRLTHGDNTFLFMGDAEKEEEEALIKSGCDLNADVLKVGHHGLSTSSRKEFLLIVFPAYAVISCDDIEKHVSVKPTCSRIALTGAETFRTDNRGTVVIESDGVGLNVLTEKSETE